MKAIYRGMCPNCEDRISDLRLYKKHPCEVCLDEEIKAEVYFDLIKGIRDALKLRGTLKHWEELYSLEKKLNEAEELFKKATGFTFWSAQKTWVKR
ncbi:hypothetical protein, partial [Thermococcus sibiricus]